MNGKIPPVQPPKLYHAKFAKNVNRTEDGIIRGYDVIAQDQVETALKEGPVEVHIANLRLPVYSAEDAREAVSLQDLERCSELPEAELAQAVTFLERRVDADFRGKHRGEIKEVGAYGAYNRFTDPAHQIEDLSVSVSFNPITLNSPGQVVEVADFYRHESELSRLERAYFQLFDGERRVSAFEASQLAQVEVGRSKEKWFTFSGVGDLARAQRIQVLTEATDVAEAVRLEPLVAKSWSEEGWDPAGLRALLDQVEGEEQKLKVAHALLEQGSPYQQSFREHTVTQKMKRPLEFLLEALDLGKELPDEKKAEAFDALLARHHEQADNRSFGSPVSLGQRKSGFYRALIKNHSELGQGWTGQLFERLQGSGAQARVARFLCAQHPIAVEDRPRVTYQAAMLAADSPKAAARVLLPVLREHPAGTWLDKMVQVPDHLDGDIFPYVAQALVNSDAPDFGAGAAMKQLVSDLEAGKPPRPEVSAQLLSTLGPNRHNHLLHRETTAALDLSFDRRAETAARVAATFTTENEAGVPQMVSYTRRVAQLCPQVLQDPEAALRLTRPLDHHPATSRLKTVLLPSAAELNGLADEEVGKVAGKLLENATTGDFGQMLDLLVSASNELSADHRERYLSEGLTRLAWFEDGARPEDVARAKGLMLNPNQGPELDFALQEDFIEIGDTGVLLNP